MLLIILLSLLAHNSVHPEPIPWLEIAYNASRTSITLQMLKNTTNYLFGPDYLHSWCGNFRYSTQNIHYPQSVGEVQQIVKNAIKVRVLGQRHSSSRIADSNDTIISTLALKQVLAFDPVVPSVIVQGGITYTDLAPFLQYLGYGLPNLASLGEITVAGAIQTGAHGSGRSLQNLANHVRSMQLVLADGSLRTYGPNDPELKAAAVGLGAFGVITQVELKLVPTFNVTNYVFLNMPLLQLFAHFDEIQELGYSVQLFTDFHVPGVWNQVWINVRSDSNSTVRSMETLFGATKAKGQVSPVPLFLSPTFMADQGKEQPWHYGLVDYHLGLSGTDGTEIETEYFLPYENAVPALKALAALSPTFSPLLLYFLVRTAKADDLWMSGSYGEDTVIINLTFLPFMPGVAVILPLVEQTLIPFGCRPHWGKVFLMGPEQFLQHYPKIQEFRALAQEVDPTHKFRNPFLDYNVFSDNTTGTTVNNILTGIIDGTLYNVGTGAILNNIAGAIGLVSGNIYGSLFGK
ncbi:FAD binding domain-containing protein [Ditylenchus destructor]|nr:FAD binding domain-containing protein [Ditylenchus destructor]